MWRQSSDFALVAFTLIGFCKAMSYAVKSTDLAVHAYIFRVSSNKLRV